MSARSLLIAQQILDACAGEGHSVTPMKLLKLAYIAHGYALSKHGSPLFHEPIQAWQYGPVVDSIYQRVRGYRDMPIRDKIWPHTSNDLSKAHKQVIQEVAETYGAVDSVSLAAAINSSGTPWRITRDASQRNVVLPNDLIRYFYNTILSQPSHNKL